MRRSVTLLLGSLAIAITAPANAETNVYNPYSTAFANVFGPYVAGGQVSGVQAEITNGVVGNSYDGTGGSYTSTSTSADHYYNHAEVLSNTNNAASASADLANASVHAYVGIGNGPLQRGFASADIADTVFFNNTSGSTIYLGFSFGFDGSVTAAPNFISSASSALTFQGTNGIMLQSGVGAGQTIVIGYSSHGTENAIQQGGAFFYNAGDNIDLNTYSVTKDWDIGAGVYSTVVSSILAIPVGESSLGYKLNIRLDCSQAGSICDFGNTSKFGFIGDTTGLQISSASGVFPSGASVPGGVPEPATWAMLILGFGTVGAAMRRRKPMLVQA